ncbi:MAG: sigma-70 family RNA polymerase sigma factor [Prevotella sp.]|nr:sigma-70 family RNA polymerase sigma factor [Prevotella sp.]
MVTSESQEQRLVKRLQDGDKVAAREFYALFADSLAGVCSRYIADEEDLKDVFQNALVHIFSHIADFRYRGEGSLQAWATKVVVNESLKFLREKKRHELLYADAEVPDSAQYAATSSQLDDPPPIDEISPDAVRQMLSRLPTGYRTVLNLYVFEGKSHQEIARLLGIRKDSSASQLHRAKSLLAKMIRKYNEDNPPPR